MTRYIAIVTSKDYYPGYGDDGHETIITSITDWTEVTDDEFKALDAARTRLNFMIFERPTDMKAFVAKTVADYLAFAKAEEKRMAEEKKKREEAALERKFKKELKDKASKLKMLKKLQEELGVDAT